MPCHREILIHRGFVSKPTEKAKVPLTKRSTHFLMTFPRDFKRFQEFDFEATFLESENFLRKTGVMVFS